MVQGRGNMLGGHEFESQQGQETFLQDVNAGFATHPASYLTYTGFFAEVEAAGAKC